MGLVAGDAGVVASHYGLGRVVGPMSPAARGELGRVWRLPTAGGVVAVKELFVPPTEEAAAADVAFQLSARRAGVLLPLPVRRPDGRVLAALASGVTVRVYEWVDLRPREDGAQRDSTSTMDTASPGPDEQLGMVLARLHLMSEPTTDPPDPWFVEPVGEPAWSALLDTVDSARAPFAAGLRRLLPELLTLEEVLPVPVRGDERRCHLDLDDSNLGRDDQGRLVVLDWENSGPASPVSELAMVVADHGSERAARLCGGYRDAGGPAVIRTPSDFATAIAVQGHLIEFYARRWLTTADADDRSRSESRLNQNVRAPLTRARIADIIAAIQT